jgi:hypothetical protein
MLRIVGCNVVLWNKDEQSTFEEELTIALDNVCIVKS